jgi:uncharacterized membrane protein YgaE (UPF0421/DUF939 family)
VRWVTLGGWLGPAKGVQRTASGARAVALVAGYRGVVPRLAFRIDASGPALREVAGQGAQRLRAQWWTIAQTAVAAAIAWQLARLAFPSQRPFFAPVAAVISLGAARGRRTRRALELSVGVALGIGVADLIVAALGTGALAILLVAGLTMVAAVSFSPSPLLVNQAAVSGILVAALAPPGGGLTPYRFLQALLGGAVALLIGNVLFPRDPVQAMARAGRGVTDALADVLCITAKGLREGDLDTVLEGLARAQAVEGRLDAFHDAVGLARETASVLPRRRRALARLPAYAQAAIQIEYGVRNTRVLARSAVAYVRRYGVAPAQLAEAVRVLADAVCALGRQLEDPSRREEARALATRAAAIATRAHAASPEISAGVVVGQVRSTAVDLLRGTGLDAEEARAALDRGVASLKSARPADVPL